MGGESSGIGQEMAGSVDCVRFGPFALGRATRQLLGPAGEIPLSPKAFALLTYLVDERPRVLSKEELLDRVWPGVFVAEQNVKNLVAEIRGALEDDASEPRFIRTVFGVGYAFCADAAEDGARPDPMVAAYLVMRDTVHRVYVGETLLGRDSDCAIVVEAPGVSRRHARILASVEGLLVEDLGSKNGTWVNGVRLEAPRALADGDQLRIGMRTMTCRVHTRHDTSTIAN